MSKVYIDKKGYKRFKASGKLVDRHVMERKLGFRLRKDVMVYHINGIKTDNRFENLRLMTKKEYPKQHTVKKERDNLGVIIIGFISGIVKTAIWVLKSITKLIIYTIKAIKHSGIKK